MLVCMRKAAFQSESGVALLLTLILMVVFSLLSVSLFELLKASTQISGNHRLDLRATCAADAGVEDAINRLRADPDNPDDPLIPYSFSGTLAGSTYSVTITDSSPSNMAIYDEKDISSTGTVMGLSRTAQAHVRIIKVFGTDPIVYIVMVTSWELQ